LEGMTGIFFFSFQDKVSVVLSIQWSEYGLGSASGRGKEFLSPSLSPQTLWESTDLLPKHHLTQEYRWIFTHKWIKHGSNSWIEATLILLMQSHKSILLHIFLACAQWGTGETFNFHRHIQESWGHPTFCQWTYAVEWTRLLCLFRLLQVETWRILKSNVVQHEFVPRGQTVTGQLYLEVKKRLREAEQSRRPEGWRNKTRMLQHNAPVHTLLLVRECLAKLKSWYLQSVYFLFPRLKSTLQGSRFQTTEETEENSLRDVRATPQNAFQDAFQNEKSVRSGV
jgi:hypothetical protein